MRPQREALVADDQPHNLESAKTGLEFAGYEVILTAQLDNALELASVAAVELILLGVPLPPEDELSCDIARAIRAEPALAHVPIVFLIGKAAARDRFPACLDLPGTSFIATPFDPAELATLLKLRLVGQYP